MLGITRIFMYGKVGAKKFDCCCFAGDILSVLCVQYIRAWKNSFCYVCTAVCMYSAYCNIHTYVCTSDIRTYSVYVHTVLTVCPVFTYVHTIQDIYTYVEYV